MKTYLCPVCGGEMIQTRRGATLAKRGPAYRCSVDVSERFVNADGSLGQVSNAKHEKAQRSWEPDDLDALARAKSLVGTVAGLTDNNEFDDELPF